MKPVLLATAIALAISGPLSAQSSPMEIDVTQPPAPDPVADAIRRFHEARGKEAKPNEVVVDFTSSGTATPAKEPAAKPAPPAPPADNKPEKTTPPPAAETEPHTPTPAPAADPAPPVPAPKEGLSVKVERLQTGTGTIDPAAVKLLAPFPAKPLGAIPPGWKLDPEAKAPAFTRSVELAPKSAITLTIKPHVLVPESNATSAFSVNEPGFDPAQGYRQIHTVGAVLSRSLNQLDEDAKQLGSAIEQLQQLVSSLPKPAPKPAPKAEAKPAPAKPTPKR